MSEVKLNYKLTIQKLLKVITMWNPFKKSKLKQLEETVAEATTRYIVVKEVTTIDK